MRGRRTPGSYRTAYTVVDPGTVGCHTEARRHRELLPCLRASVSLCDQCFCEFRIERQKNGSSLAFWRVRRTVELSDFSAFTRTCHSSTASGST